MGLEISKKNAWTIVKRITAVLGFAAVLSLPSSPGLFAGNGGPEKKPQAPIALGFSTEGAVMLGSPLTVMLTVTPLIASESVSVSILLPDGLSLLEGDIAWSGPLEADQSHILTIRVRPETAASLEVKARAALTRPGGSSISRHAVLTLDPGPAKPKPRLRERRGPGGDSILEIPAQRGPKNP